MRIRDAKGQNRIRPARIATALPRRVVAAGLSLLMLLRIELRCGRRTSEVSVDVVVCLTTYGDRAPSAVLAIESILRGTCRPARLVLYLAEADWAIASSRRVRLLRQKGLEIERVKDYRSHKKYLPYVLNEDVTVSLVVADDDVLYARNWLADLVRVAEGNREPMVVCHRAHVVKLDQLSGAVRPYNDWPRCESTEPRLNHFATGVGGVLYPPQVLKRLRELGKLGLTGPLLQADDVWLHGVATIDNVATVQCRSTPRDFPVIPGSQRSSLLNMNVGRGGNDRAISFMQSELRLGNWT